MSQCSIVANKKQSSKLNIALQSPWAITEDGLKLVVAVASRDEFFAEVREEALAARSGRPLDNARNVQMRGSVAVVPIHGPLFKHSSMLTKVSATSSYDQLRSDLQTALEDPSVKSILMDIDSPGGEANGCGELANAISEIGKSKPVHAYVGGMGASAAYWIASAASTITCSDTAELGSIGVRMAMVDDRKAQEAEGMRTIDFVSSQSPFKVLDVDKDEDKARLQTRIDALADVFIGNVAKNRGVTASDVKSRFGRGDLLVGQSAVDAGLADRIGNLEETIERLNGANQMKSIVAAMGMSASATELEVVEAVNALKNANAKLLAVTECANVELAVSTVAAWKQNAESAIDLKAKLAKQEAEAKEREFSAVLEGAIKSALLPPSSDHKAHAYALSCKDNADAVGSLKKYLETLSPITKETASANPAVAEPATGTGTVSLTADELRVAKQMNISPELLAKNKLRRLSMNNEIKTADDSAE